MSVIILDDRDPSIQYIGSWNNGGNPDAEYQATVKWSGPAPGTFATLVFNGAPLLSNLPLVMPSFSGYF